MRAIIDPQFVACHLGQTGDVGSHVQSILETYRNMRDQRLDLLSSDQLFASLSNAGVYPLRESYDVLLAASGISHTNGTDLARVVLRLIQESTVLEDLVADAQLGMCGCKINESLTAGCDCHSELNEAVESAFHAYAATQVIDEDGAPAFVLTCREGRSGEKFASNVEFVGVLSHKDELFENVGIRLELESARSLTDFLLTADPQVLMLRAHEDESLVAIAIQAAAMQAFGGEIADWSMSDRFAADAVDLGMSRTSAAASKFLRSCVETLLDQSMGDTHWLRTTAGGSAPQVVRSGAAAWRRDVDRYIHIHYWVLADGSKQFASVVQHNVFGIPGPI